MFQPLVSVIMNCYNGETYLKEAIESVLSQTYMNWELIFWDNLSTDKSVEIVKSFNDKRIQYYRGETFVTLGLARNFAISKCMGEYVAFLDVDDLWLPEKLNIQVNEFYKNSDVELIYSDCMYVDSELNKVQLGSKVEKPYSGMVFEKLLERDFIALSAAIFRKSIIDKTGGFSDKYSIVEDHDFFLRISEKYPVKFINQVLMLYRMHKGNYSRNYEVKYHEETLLYCYWLQRVSDDRQKRKIIKKAIALSHIKHSIYALLKDKRLSFGVSRIITIYFTNPLAFPATTSYFLKQFKNNIPRLVHWVTNPRQ